MGGFLGALKSAGKAIGRREKKRYGFMPSAPKSAGSAGADPVADAVSADRKKKRSAKGRD